MSTVIMTLSDKELPSAAGTEKCKKELGSMPDIPEFLLLNRDSARDAACAEPPRESDDSGEGLSAVAPAPRTGRTSSKEESS